MDITTYLTDLYHQHIDPIAVVMVLLGGLFSKKYLANISAMGDTWKTLLTGSLFITLYVIVLHLSGELRREDYTKFFISYTVATSLYDTILKHLIKKIPGFADKKRTLNQKTR